MKKKLEAELISIAHRILKLKSKSDLAQLHNETQKLYEKLSVLLFVEEHLSDVKPTIGRSEIDERIESAFESNKMDVSTLEEQEEDKVSEFVEVSTMSEHKDDNESEEEVKIPDELEPLQEVEIEEPQTEEEAETVINEDNAVGPEEKESERVEPEVETAHKEEVISEDSSFKPAFELSFDLGADDNKEEVSRTTAAQITFDDLLGADYVDPVFVKPEELVAEKEVKESDNVIPIGRNYNDSAPVISLNTDNATNTTTLNDRVAKGLIIGLNDRIAFMNHLFANSSEDYNRVLSQLMTFNTLEEANDFIENMVKPDYNNWEGKEEYAARFMEIVEKKFS